MTIKAPYVFLLLLMLFAIVPVAAQAASLELPLEKVWDGSPDTQTLEADDLRGEMLVLVRLPVLRANPPIEARTVRSISILSPLWRPPMRGNA